MAVWNKQDHDTVIRCFRNLGTITLFTRLLTANMGPTTTSTVPIKMVPMGASTAQRMATHMAVMAMETVTTMLQVTAVDTTPPLTTMLMGQTLPSELIWNVKSNLLGNSAGEITFFKNFHLCIDKCCQYTLMRRSVVKARIALFRWVSANKT